MRHGAKKKIADHLADAVAESESLGYRRCGLYYLESYCQHLSLVASTALFKSMVSKPKETAICVDAGFGFEQPAFAKGLTDTLTQAQSFGISTLSVGLPILVHGWDISRDRSRGQV